MYKVKTTKGLQGLHAIGDCHRGYQVVQTIGDYYKRFTYALGGR
jgi:hypothetical protein